MSGLLERIARRRRASASSRLGPHSESSASPVNGSAHPNGGTRAQSTAEVNGSAHAANGAGVPETVSWPGSAEADVDTTGTEAVVDATEHRSEAVEPDPPAVEPDPPAVEPDPPAAEPRAAEPGPPLPEPRTDPHQPVPQALREGATAVAPGFVERGRMRRRARYLRQLREVQMRDIGGFLLELHRFGRQRPDLVQEKVLGAAQTDRELRALERALDEGHPLRELREPGIGGTCPSCGAVHGSADRFCAACGSPLTRRARPRDAG